MVKKTLKATFEGVTFTRTTAHDYKFVLIESDDKRPEWGVWAWSTRKELLEKQIRTIQNRPLIGKDAPNAKFKIIPVDGE